MVRVVVVVKYKYLKINTNMKKILFVILSSLSVSLMAQNEVDALRYSQNYYIGTARFMSTGGAFSSLAADMSAISINPAALGKYKGSEITITPYFSLNSSSALYNGNTRDNFRYHFQMECWFGCKS